MRPQAWCTPMGPLAVIGPSMNDQWAPLWFLARRVWKASVSFQKRRMSRSREGKSTLWATSSNMLLRLHGVTG